MKKVIRVSLIMSLIVLLAGCSTIQTEFIELEQCIDDMVEEKSNDVCTPEDRKELLKSYASEIFDEASYSINKMITYNDSGLNETIEFQINVYPLEEYVTVDFYNEGEQIYVTLLNDFSNMNNDIKYSITIIYINESYTLKFTHDDFYEKVEISIISVDNFETAYSRIEDLLILLSDNDIFDTVYFDMSASDFEFNIMLSINLGYYSFGIGELDKTSLNSFENIIDNIDETMRNTDLISHEAYQQSE